jgi:putative acetyltransferase
LVVIRPETASDREAVFRVVDAAFGEDPTRRSAARGLRVAPLVDELRDNGHCLLSLVAEDEGEIVGHVLFSPMTIEGAGGTWDAVCLSPLAVEPSRQRQGIGGLLIEAGLRELRAAGHRTVVLLGHPAYYPRFGFRPARDFGLHYQDDRDAFMAIELYPGALDEVSGNVEFSPEFEPFE